MTPIKPDDAAQVLALANAQRYAELESKGQELILHSPRSEFSWDVLVAALKMQGKDVLCALQQAVTHIPDSAKMHGNLANAYREHGRMDEAYASYQQALMLDPTLAELHCNLGNILRDRGKFSDAVLSYQRALAVQPDFAEVHNNMGNALSDMGRLEAAAASYRNALLCKPDFSLAYCNLGTVLNELDRCEEAIVNFDHALACDPAFAATYNGLGCSQAKLGQFDKAIVSYQRALELNPDFSGVYNNLGNALQEVAQFQLAETSYQRALAINPMFPEAYNNLGNNWRERGRLHDAMTCFQNALIIKPDYADAHHNLAIVLRQQGRITEALASSHKALSINPRLVKAIVFLAETHADNGEFSQAETLYQHAISIEPAAAEAWAGIARIRKMTSADMAWLEAVNSIVAQALPPRKEVYLRYALGKFHNDVQDFEQAFENYRRANALSKLYGEKYEPTSHTAIIDTFIQTFNRDWLNREGIKPNLSARPVLVIGMPRSGTSLVEQILASHPDVFGAGELTFWDGGLKTLKQAMQKDEPCAEVLSRLAEDYLQVLHGFSSDALRVVDKMPANFMFLGMIHAAFPRASIIHMQRNPIDTCLSIYFQHFDNALYYTNDLADIAHYYQQYLRLMDHWRSTLPAHTILDVPYEGLVDDQEGWSRKILDFIGLSWNQNCIDFERSTRTVSTTSNWQVRQKIYRSSVQRWRHYEKFIAPLLTMLEQ